MHVMKGLSIRGRLLLAALLPVALVSAALLSLDLFGRMTGAELFGFAQTQRHTEAVLAYVAVAVVGILFGAWFALWLARRHENLTHGLIDELTQSGARADQNLRDQMARIEQATQAKSRFLAAASHDLRQPTHALGMFVERLRQLPLDAEAVQLIANLDASVQSMQDLLDALLDISRLEAQVVTAEVRPFALNELFDKLRIATGPIALQKGLRLRIRPTRVWLLSDAGQVHRILQNLLGNAMAYTPSGTVLLSCRPLRGGSMARIQVWDSGVGIAPEHHEAVFKDYFQVANPARDSSKGLGLGLHIVDLIARLLGLPVQLRSNLGCGSRFSIDVPLALQSDGSVDILQTPDNPAVIKEIDTWSRRQHRPAVGSLVPAVIHLHPLESAPVIAPVSQPAPQASIPRAGSSVPPAPVSNAAARLAPAPALAAPVAEAPAPVAPIAAAPAVEAPAPAAPVAAPAPLTSEAPAAPAPVAP